MTEKYSKIRARNEREAERCRIRDRDEKQDLIDRQDLQDQMKPILRKHRISIVQLKKDVGNYMEMGALPQKDLQSNLNQMDQEEQLQKERG